MRSQIVYYNLPLNQNSNKILKIPFDHLKEDHKSGHTFIHCIYMHIGLKASFF